MSSKSSIQVKLVLDEEMRNEEIINEIRKIVENACKKETNYFGYGTWTHHITSVVKWARTLARKSNADEEIVEIAALLHDYASIVNINNYSGHHTRGAELAEEIKKYGYPRDKIEKIKHCIVTHRSSIDLPRKTIEAKIVASADAMSFFDNIHSLLYLAYIRHKMNIDEGAKWVLNKLEKAGKNHTGS